MPENNRTAAGAFIVVAVIIVLAVASCSGKKDAFEPGPFTYQADMVDSVMEITELNLQFAPPAGWRMMDSVQLDNFRRMLGGTELAREFYPIFPMIAFSDSATGGLFYIARIEESETDLSRIAGEYRDYIESKTTAEARTPANYLINDMKVYYYLVRSSRIINYKLVGQTAPDKRFLIEYVIGGVFYTQVEPAVSSSISTLKPITPLPDSL